MTIAAQISQLIASMKGAMSIPAGGDRIYLIDCLEWMRMQPNKSVDLIITDPPYGLDIAQRGQITTTGRKFTPKAWDASRPRKIYFDEMRRISKNQIIWGGNYFADYLPASKCWLTWWKNDGLPRLNFADCELAWTSFDRPSYVFNCRWRSNVRDSKEPRLPHPTQKALAVMEWCVQTFAEPGQIILDPFFGTGTTGLAARSFDCRYIGIEKDPEYYEIAIRRLSTPALA